MSSNLGKFKVLCLAGGFGTRVKHILKSTPKPLAIINGKPFLYWLVKDLKSYGAGEITLLTHYKQESFTDFAQKYSSGECIIKCIQEKKPEGTGGAILSAIRKLGILDQNLVIVNGDTFVEIDYPKLLTKLKGTCEMVMTAKDVEDTSRYGSLILNNSNMLVELKEKITGKGFVNAGVFAVNPSLFYDLRIEERPLSLEKDLIPLILKSKKSIKVEPILGKFLDIGTEESLISSGQFLSEIFEKKNA